MSARNIHIIFATWALPSLTVCAVTGLLWAYAPYLYWQPGYKEKKRSVSAPALAEAQLSFTDAVARASSETGAAPAEISLRSEAGMLLYKIAFPKPPKTILIDARSGELLSPISSEFARTIASQYIRSPTSPSTVTFIDTWTDRKGVVFDSVAAVRFDDPAETEIVVDRASGEIIEDSDRVRRFHFWVMALHQLSFFGTKKELTVLNGVPLLVLIATGLVMLRKRSRLRKRSP